MSLPIERWAKQAVLLEKRGDYVTPAADTRVLRDIGELARLEKQTWRARQQEILDSGELMGFPEGIYGANLNPPNAATITTTSINGTANLWPGAVYSPINANSVLLPHAWRVAVQAKITTSTSPGNIGIDPRIGQGTWTTGGTAITGTTLGASGNVALTASITAAFYTVKGDIILRSGGAPGGNNWTFVGMFHYFSTQGTSGGLAGPAAIGTGHNLMFGGTSAAVDGSTALGIQMGAVHTVTTVTHNVEQIHVADWN